MCVYVSSISGDENEERIGIVQQCMYTSICRALLHLKFWTRNFLFSIRWSLFMRSRWLKNSYFNSITKLRKKTNWILFSLKILWWNTTKDEKSKQHCSFSLSIHKFIYYQENIKSFLVARLWLKWNQTFKMFGSQKTKQKNHL